VFLFDFVLGRFDLSLDINRIICFSAKVSTKYEAACSTSGDYTKPCFAAGLRFWAFFSSLLCLVTLLGETLITSVFWFPSVGEYYVV